MARTRSRTMQFFVGTSGYSYPAWKGIFYPEKLPQKEMLRYYAERFATVEANNTFRGMPKASALESWNEKTPESFRFAIKAPMTFTHIRRLKNLETETEDLLQAASVLKARLGPLLFQLPENFQKDLPRLDGFLKLLAGRARAAFEFRHESWEDDEVYDCLRRHSCALCNADTDEKPRTDVVSTTDWGYLRLRRSSYSDNQLAQWIAKIRATSWSEAYVFFMHEDTGTGPRFATCFLELVAN